jgi:ribosomal protein S2
MNGRPALALTSELVAEIMCEYVHTERDTPEIIDLEKVAAAAQALYQLIQNL